MPYLTAMHRENEILQQIAQGDERAFAALFNHFHQPLGLHIFKFTKSEQLAEEVVQDVFLKIWLNRELLVGIDNFRVYLYVISKNAALNCLKKVANESARIVDLDPQADTIAAENIEEDHRYLLIDEAIDRLPPQQKQVYLLRRHERLSYPEIAAQMKISKETVKKYLQIATESITSHIRKRLVISFLIAAKYFF
ncbi:RNA polymerase sigma factor [Dyadobacter aurulentus]|uniref:RNA polymerase sigma factor n=1 Tax=Dyadobacter sp. UC 10 TaxID=2605428 RepID=UPI0011F24340|nr:sigma-70 family RNA polymerase sigma factor [Dyadobacter sp. UC 10]KAA0989210.1 sigma-70 family RNA polymerase sigma factor [Dyadobacter sp. UC 10]